MKFYLESLRSSMSPPRGMFAENDLHLVSFYGENARDHVSNSGFPRLRNETFMYLLKRVKISMLVVGEAHCISQVRMHV